MIINDCKLIVYFKSLIIILIILPILSCDEKREDSHIYISSVNNLSTQEPFHEVLCRKKDSLYKYKFDEDKVYLKSGLHKKSDTIIVLNDGKTYLKLNNYTYYPNFEILSDSTHLYTYVKTDRGYKISTEEFQKKTKNLSFETQIENNKTPNSAFDIIERVTFSQDSINYYWDYYYNDHLVAQEFEQVELNYYEVEGELFLVPSSQDNPYPILQVFRLANEKLELRYFTDFITKSKKYSTRAKTESNNYKVYKLCMDHFQKHYFVGEDLRYSKGLEHLKSLLKDNAPLALNDGFINLHFIVNCKGEVGRFGLELLDLEYKPTNFNPEIIEHITEVIANIKDWNNVEHEPYYGSKDIKAFFLIKIEDGKILDVCP